MTSKRSAERAVLNASMRWYLARNRWEAAVDDPNERLWRRVQVARESMNRACARLSRTSRKGR